MKKRKFLLLALTTLTLWGCGTPDSGDAKTSSANQTSSEEDTIPAQEDTTEKDLSETENDSASTEKTSADNTVNPEDLTAVLIRHKYNGVLSQLVCAQQLPNGYMIESPYDWDMEMTDNSYAITDMDGDGYEELVIIYSTASMAGMFETIYGYNPETDTLTQEFMGFPSVTFYDNGMIREDASHNQSYGELWPFGLYQYDAASDSYSQVGYVDTWDVSINDTSYDYESKTELPFPTDKDTDGDGILYNIQKGDSNNYSWDISDYQYNKSDFEEWYDSYFNGAEEIAPETQPIDSEIFTAYTKDYLAMVQENKEAANPSTGTDIGLMFVAGDSSLQDVSQMLADNYGITIEQPYEDFEEEWVGKYEGQEVFDFMNLNAGSIGYKDVQVEDITIFDLYPGMPEEEALKTIEAYG
ncbi:MAG: hypothetical protein PUD93_09590, partial [Lachnospiraceae bacterium]|nr:hypothetical protein [Lachnospiraceae bacterium]